MSTNDPHAVAPVVPASQPAPAAPPVTSGMAIGSLVLGLASCGLSILTGIPAIIMGFLALGKIKQSGGRLSGSGLAVAGVVLGFLSVIPGLLLVVLLPAVMAARQAAVETESKMNMRVIGTAMMNHHENFNAWPAAGVNQQGDRPNLSWRVRLLPFIDEGRLCDEFRQDEPWDSDHNKTLIARMPEMYKSPGIDLEEGKTVYLAVTGADTIFAGPVSANDRRGRIRRQMVRDGMSQTVMLVEAAPDQAVIWTKPDDWEFDPDDPRRGLQSKQRRGILALFADSAVQTIPYSVDDETLRRLFMRDDGETIDRTW